MPVSAVAARTASCWSRGCWWQDRVLRCPSDLTDAQWAVLEPRAREVMAELVVAAGRPMVHDLRAVCDAIAYVTRNGIEWRALAPALPPRGGADCSLQPGGDRGPARGVGDPPGGTRGGGPGPQRHAVSADRPRLRAPHRTP